MVVSIIIKYCEVDGKKSFKKRFKVHIVFLVIKFTIETYVP